MKNTLSCITLTSTMEILKKIITGQSAQEVIDSHLKRVNEAEIRYQDTAAGIIIHGFTPDKLIILRRDYRTLVGVRKEHLRVKRSLFGIIPLPEEEV